MVRTVVTGISGRMGTAIVRAVRDDDEAELVGAVDRAGSAAVGLDVGLACRLGPMEVQVGDDLAGVLARGADVVIDFTSVEGSLEYAKVCADARVPLVVGTTGFSPEARAQIAQVAEKIPLLMAPNMSVGVNLMLQLAAEAARVLGDSFEVEIVEMHHRRKKDAPSGTALRLAEVIASTLGRDPEKHFRTSRSGMIGERPKQEIGIQTLRGGDVVGEHTVYFIADGERLEITHRATSRDQFALGAVRAARFLVGRKPGLYDMADVLGLKRS